MSTNLSIFEYEGQSISFNFNEGDIMINLTEVAKAFPDKNLTHIVNSQEIREYVEKLSAITNVIPTDLLTVRRGGANNGTWAHQKVALRVAQKLSTDFAIWVDEKIETLLTKGKVSINEYSEDDIVRLAMETLTKRVEAQKKKIDLLEQEVEESAPKVQFAESFKASSSIMLVRDLAKYINQNIQPMGESRLYDWLVNNKYLIRNKRWSNSKNKYEFDYMPTQKASDLKIFHVEPTVIHARSGDVLFTKHTVKINAKGQSYFIDKLLKEEKQHLN